MPETQFKREILHSDFEQSMEMLRHYDNFHWDITKFCFGQICVIIGACWYIYEQIPIEKQTFKLFELDIPIIGILLCVSALFTFLCIISLLRNRTYFCRVSHYINELRNYSLIDNELTFRNDSGMWHDSSYPPLKDFLSTQSLSVYLLGICMVISTIIGSYILLPDNSRIIASLLVGAMIILILLAIYRTILK